MCKKNDKDKPFKCDAATGRKSKTKQSTKHEERSSSSRQTIHLRGSELLPRDHPILNITILGARGTGLIDSAVKQSIAGKHLYNVLIKKRQQFNEQSVSVRLADGTVKNEILQVTKVNVFIENRVVPTTFLVFSNAEYSLLGVDFINDAKLVFYVANAKWNFSDVPEVKYELLFENTFENAQRTVVHLSFTTVLRDHEGAGLSIEKRDVMNGFFTEYSHVFDNNKKATPNQHFVVMVRFQAELSDSNDSRNTSQN
ncbi:hypothetical protein FQA39_LY17047 [Lamprigera yunnana]|nr:hypothetical protein FQA39_LY17047 [Lamprigera yunnana]